MEIPYKKVQKAIIGEDSDQKELIQKISKNVSRVGSSERKKNTNRSISHTVSKTRSMSHTNVSKVFKQSTNDLGSFIRNHSNRSNKESENNSHRIKSSDKIDNLKIDNKNTN